MKLGDASSIPALPGVMRGSVTDGKEKKATGFLNVLGQHIRGELALPRNTRGSNPLPAGVVGTLQRSERGEAWTSFIAAT